MTIKPEDFLTQSLKEQTWGHKVARILAASISAVDPQRLIADRMNVIGAKLKIDEECYSLDEYKRIFILSIGKAALPMAYQAGEILGNYLHKALILTKSRNQTESQINPERFEIYYGGHPVPDQSSLDSTAAILEQLDDLTSKDLVLILISGGGSALFSSPAPGISLEDLQHTNQVLLNCGVSILEFNTIRKHISNVKGGLLAKRIYPARTVTLALNDVTVDRIDMIASGISVPDPTTYLEALTIIDRFGIKDSLPGSILEYLEYGQQGNLPETPKPGDEIFDHSYNSILADVRDAIRGAVDQAELEGLVGESWRAFLSGEAKLIGRSEVKDMLKMIKQRGIDNAVMYAAGGEPKVTLPDFPPPEKGGRSLEAALSTVEFLEGIKDICIVTLATDGEDGSSDAAGGVVTGETFQRAIEKGLDPDEYLANHDSYRFFDSLGDLIKIGPTLTNVNDLLLLFKFKGNL